MQFIGSTTYDWEGKQAFRIRNKITIFVHLPDNSLDILKNGPRYVEFYQDFAGRIWAKRPAGPQILVKPPYTIITRTPAGLVAKEVLDT